MKRTAAFFLTFFLLLHSSFSQNITAENSKNYVGKTITVAGKVVDGRYLVSTGRQPTLLNIDKAFPNQIFSIVIYGDNRKLFGYKPEEALLNKNVLVTGKVELYNGKPQINVTNPEQIVIANSTTDIKNGILQNAAAGEIKLKSAVKLRSGPGNKYKTIAKLKDGSLIKVLHSDNGWSYISVKRTTGKEDNEYSLSGFIKSEELN